MPDTRVALVAGANQGVGRHVAQELAANGLRRYLIAHLWTDR